VLLDRLLAEEELGRDLLVGLATGDQLGYLALPPAEGRDAVADLLATPLRPLGC
jgi:hypothetical protein